METDLLGRLQDILNQNQGIIALLAFLAPLTAWAIRRLTKKKYILNSIDPTITVESTEKGLMGFNDHSDEPEFHVRYKLVDQNRIEPTCPYIQKLDSGARIGANAYHNTPFNIQMPMLVLDLVNRSSKSLLITGIQFRVHMSLRDERPIPIFRNVAGPFQLVLENEGRAPMKNVSLSFYFSTSNEPETEELRYTITEKEIKGRHVFDVSEHLASEGVDIKYLAEEAGTDRLYLRMAASEEEEDSFKRMVSSFNQRLSTALGPYGSLQGLLLPIHGKLIYEYELDNGQISRVSIPFSTEVWILQKAFAPPPLAAEYDIHFKTEGLNYRISKTDIHYLVANSAHRFNLRLFSDESSTHKFDLLVETDLGTKLIARDMSLKLFIPRSAPLSAKDSRKRDSLTR